MLNPVSLEVTQIGNYALRIRLTDANKRRYVVPIIINGGTALNAGSTLYDLKVTRERFGIVVTRNSTGTVVFNSTLGPLLYADQFLQVS